MEGTIVSPTQLSYEDNPHNQIIVACLVKTKNKLSPY